jgi:probable rRNA maturation factor
MSSKSKVYFFFDDVKPNLRSRNKIKVAIEYIFKNEGKALASVNYVFCSDERLLAINREYLKHDYYTDIVTFDLSEGREIRGEVYISAERVRENARLLKVPVVIEQLRVIFHGALHLCGYRDDTASHKNKMRVREDQYIAVFRKRFT